MLLNLSVDTLVEGVALSDQLMLSLLSHPEVFAMDLLQDSHLHVPLGVAWQVVVLPSSLYIYVNIAQMFLESVSKTPVCCANVLLLTVCNSAGDGIAQVLGVAFHLAGQVH